MSTMRASLLSAGRTAFVATAIVGAALLVPVATGQAAPEQGTPPGPATTRQVPTTVLDVRGIPTGQPPAIAWAETGPRRSLLHAADGTTTPAPRRLAAFAPMGTGWVVQSMRPGRPRVRQLRADGTVRREWARTGYGLAVSPQGGAVALTARGGRVRVVDSAGQRVVRMPSVPARWIEPAAVGTEDCQESPTSNGCAVWVNGEANARSWTTSSHGLVDDSGFLSVSTGHGAWVGGFTRIFDAGSCSTMKRGWKARWSTCRNAFSDISPDLAHVLGTPAYADGLGPGRLDLLDLRTGERVRSWRSPRRTTLVYFQEVWEDPEHVLVVTFDGDQTWSILRLGLDGSLEYAVAPRRSKDWGALHLQTR